MQPTLGLFAQIRRALFGAKVRKLHTSAHGAGLRAFGRAWATPMTVVFSLGALISLGQKPLMEIVLRIQRGQAPDLVQVAILGIAFVLVVGMDLTLLNSAMQLPDAKFRGVNPRQDPYTLGARSRVVVISIVESLTGGQATGDPHLSGPRLYQAQRNRGQAAALCRCVAQ